MDFTDEQLIVLLQDTHRCRPEVVELAGKLSALGADRYNTLARRMIEVEEDHALGILFNVAAVNRIKMDPFVLAGAYRVLESFTDITFLCKFQDEKAIDAFLAVALAEDISWERQGLAGRLAAELAVKLHVDRQPVRKTLWKLSNEISSFGARLLVEGGLGLLDVADDAAGSGPRFLIDTDLLEGLPKNRPGTVIGGDYTVRRPVAKLGRNQPCHCGSGKKYKKCCYGKDLELLRDASAYAGFTRTRLQEDPSLIEDTAPIEAMRANELKKLDPARLHDDQLLAAYRRAELFGLRELACEMLCELKSRPGKKEFAIGHMCDLFDSALSARDKKTADLLVHHIPADELYFSATDRLRHALLDGADTYAELESLCRNAIAGDPAEFESPLVDLSYAFENHLPAMSIVFGRAAIASAPECWLDNEVLLDSIGKNRIALDLAPQGDPIEEFFDLAVAKDAERSLVEEKDKTITKLQEQLADAGDKSRRAMADLRKKEIELVALEKKAKKNECTARETSAPSPTSPGPVPVHMVDTGTEERQRISALQRKIAQLKGEISAQQESKRQLRRQYQEAVKKISDLDGQPPAPAEIPSEPEEATPLADAPKIPDFTTAFRKSCERLPSAVVTKALRAAVGFATRDHAIVRQTTALERLANVFRIRIGAKYRLLLRQKPTSRTVEILDLIPRKDLETWIRKHSA